MTELPYGIADFRRIRRQDFVYVDRTAHIRDLERLGSVLVFLRPRRFGKSLWLQTLANYYDLRRAGEFHELFGDLAIGRDPTPLVNRYFVRCRRSRPDRTEGQADFEATSRSALAMLAKAASRLGQSVVVEFRA